MTPHGYRIILVATMQSIVSLAIRVLEVFFALGLAGSAIVLVLSGIEDLETLIGSEKSHPH